jgi:hypothetical protein
MYFSKRFVQNMYRSTRDILIDSFDPSLRLVWTFYDSTALAETVENALCPPRAPKIRPLKSCRKQSVFTRSSSRMPAFLKQIAVEDDASSVFRCNVVIVVRNHRCEKQKPEMFRLPRMMPTFCERSKRYIRSACSPTDWKIRSIIPLGCLKIIIKRARFFCDYLYCKLGGGIKAN